jgi:hypothetical protein
MRWVSQVKLHMLYRGCRFSLNQGKRGFCWITSTILLLLNTEFPLIDEMHKFLKKTEDQFRNQVLDTACPNLPLKLKKYFRMRTSITVNFHHIQAEEDVPHVVLKDSGDNVTEEDDIYNDMELEDFDEKSRSFILTNTRMWWHDKFFKIELGEFRDANRPQVFLEAILHASQYGVVKIRLDKITVDFNLQEQVDMNRKILLGQLPKDVLPLYNKLLERDTLGSRTWDKHHELVSQIKAFKIPLGPNKSRLEKLMQENFEEYVVILSVNLMSCSALETLETLIKNGSIVGGLLILKNSNEEQYHSVAFFKCTNGETTDVYYCNTWGLPCGKLTRILEEVSGFGLHSAELLSPRQSRHDETMIHVQELVSDAQSKYETDLARLVVQTKNRKEGQAKRRRKNDD